MDINQGLKQFTNIQSNYMFLCSLQNIPGVFNSSQSFTILARETTILTKTREAVNWRFLGRQKSLPQAIQHEGTWNVTVNLDESGMTYLDFARWFYYIDRAKLNGTTYRSNMIIQLLNYDTTVTNQAFALINVYPGNIPAIDGLNQENTEGLITFECDFKVDEVAHGSVNGTTITYVESDTSIYFPYKNELAQLTTVPIINTL